MKLFFAIILIAMSSALGFGQEAELRFERKLHKFPNAKEGDQLETVFVFQNTGNAPLIFHDYKVTCPCTKAELPAYPIRPGEKGEIRITFDTTGKTYYQDRIIEIYSNSKKGVDKLRIKVFVE
jgi:hypothetical protein